MPPAARFQPKNAEGSQKWGVDLRDDLLLRADGVELQLLEAVPVQTIESFRAEVIV